MRRAHSTDSSSAVYPAECKRMKPLPPTEKSQRYDRQLRLWQVRGQESLERSQICVFGSSALAAESLKNLILPGIGKFVVIDDATVDDVDLKSNFFISPGDLGKARAQCVVQNLCDLNPDACGTAIAKSAKSALSTETSTILRSTLVISCGLVHAVLKPLSELCWMSSIPLIVAESSGFAAYIRISSPEHTVVESHEKGQQSDMRLLSPFPALREHIDSIDLEALDPTDLAHIPYVVIIVKALAKWANQNNKEITKTTRLPYSTKKDIAELVRTMASASDKENFEEAASNINGSCIPYEVPQEITKILKEADGIEITKETDRFWILAKALSNYLKSDYAGGFLPHSGEIPDMKADTKGYISLQQIYRTKAQEDKDEFHKQLERVLIASNLSSSIISANEVDTFCKNSRRLRVLSFVPIHDEIEKGPQHIDMLSDSEIADYYALFMASNVFQSRNMRYPGSASIDSSQDDWISNIESHMDMDIELLSEIADGLLRKWGVDSRVPKDAAAEFVRSGHCELYNIASIAGGIVSQEAIKLVTHQYVPLNNTCIIDGVQMKILTAQL